ncbi:hypothetical protein H3S93_07010 [Bifidobacterium sp. W8109]|uniref:hypothetical protein n=1 Tax=Bifidobacterium sp. W8110 TaxID=2750975 RepID=UPI0018DBFF15|nr:hypothetical protein [Bifidobacterium sp. W8110]MBH9972054.1 hypothetical protein [Bifidobacterium asteroides]
MEKSENSTGKNSTGKSSGSRRRFIIIAALVLVVAVVSSGGLQWHHHSVQEHDRAFASYKAVVRSYEAQDGEYRKYLASDEVKSASAVTDNQVSDAKTVQILAKSMQTVKPASGMTTVAKTNLTGDASTSELKKVTETLKARTSKMKSKLKILKRDVLAVTTSKAHKLLSDAIGNGYKALADSEGKVPDGDQTRNDLAKDLDSAKNILNGKKSVFKAFANVKADLDAKVKAVNDAVSAKAQADAKAVASAPSMVDSGYGATARRGGNGYRAPSQNGGSNYCAPSGGGGTTAPKGGNGDSSVNRHPAWVGTTDGSDGEAHWEGDHLIGHQDF